MAPYRVRAFSIETNGVTLLTNQATQVHQLKQSITMAKIHNSTNKSSKYTCINQRKLECYYHSNNTQWRWLGGDAELAFHQADPSNTSSITTIPMDDSILQERLARIKLASHQACLQQSLLRKHKKRIPGPIGKLPWWNAELMPWMLGWGGHLFCQLGERECSFGHMLERDEAAHLSNKRERERESRMRLHGGGPLPWPWASWGGG